jgi:two-component system NtrC family sensor kinase
MYFCTTLMLIIVVLLSISGFQGVFKYRRLTKDIRDRANEAPLIFKVERSISKLRTTLHSAHTTDYLGSPFLDRNQNSMSNFDLAAFGETLSELENAVDKYKGEVENSAVNDLRIGENQKEKQLINDVEGLIVEIRQHLSTQDFFDTESNVHNLDQSLGEIEHGLDALPSLMSERFDVFADAARADYHKWFFLSGVFTLSGLILISVLLWNFNAWFFKPISILLQGSRKVASGDFTHRIVLNTRDELSELASAMNEMTQHFCEIRDNLDRKVRERSNEVIRNEQLASVGFLAAGVAHEINNPMATIAWSAESLESRLIEWVDEYELEAEDPRRQEADVILKYMRRIQDEAFRIKGITDGLLDFSRLGTSTRTETDLRELVEGIIEMVKHLGKYRSKKLAIHGPATLKVSVCTQSIKQVALNLITNALDSVDTEGHVDIHLDSNHEQVQIRVIDDGCGMSPEVLQHVFEPFFTQKQDGQGTGLGLAIAHRIVTDHQGTLIARSEGPNQGSEFCVILPRQDHAKNQDKRIQAA